MTAASAGNGGLMDVAKPAVAKRHFEILDNAEAIAESTIPVLPILDFRDAILRSVQAGYRVCALFADPAAGKEAGLRAVLADDGGSRLLAARSEPVSSYPAITPQAPQAHLFEREIYETSGIEPVGHPWLKPVRAKIGSAYPFFAEKGSEVHEVAVGPVHAGIIEPGHFRFQCHGETVHHLEIALGYQHRGLEAMLEAGPNRRSIFLAGSAAGDAVVGHATAYCMAIEALAGVEFAPRGDALRAVGLELERLANHVGDLGALSGDIGFLPAAAYFGRLRGEFLNLLMDLSGNRYGRGLARPGGATFDLTADEARRFAGRLVAARSDLMEIGDLFFSEPSVIARLEDTGVVGRRACVDLGLVGPAARACGAELDVRRDHPRGIYASVSIPVVKADSGDVYARAMVRWLEAQRSLDFLDALLKNLPPGPALRPCPKPRPGQFATALVEGWRGEICHVAMTGSDGRFARYKIVDPSFHNWMAVSLALRGGEISDFPLCNKSFNLSYAGHDL